MLKKLLRLFCCALGAAIGLGLTLLLVDPSESPVFLASIGGTCVFLFGLTSAPAAQPRAVFGGHLGGAAIGILCSQLFGTSLPVLVLACVMAMVFMLITRTTHPPAGATPLIMAHAHTGWLTLLQTVLPCVLILVIVVIIWSRIVPGMRHYPVRWLDKSPSNAWWGDWDRDRL